MEIRCVLGKTSPGITEGAAKNSTRWIFDVDHDGKAERQLRVELIDSRTGKPKTAALMSVSFTPLNASAAGARLRVASFSPLILELDPTEAVARYRVTVDTVHSMTR